MAGRNFVQVGLRGYWPPPETLDWMERNGLRYHFMTEIEERGAEAVVGRGRARVRDDRREIDLAPLAERVRPGAVFGGERDRNNFV